MEVKGKKAKIKTSLYEKVGFNINNKDFIIEDYFTNSFNKPFHELVYDGRPGIINFIVVHDFQIEDLISKEDTIVYGHEMSSNLGFVFLLSELEVLNDDTTN